MKLSDFKEMECRGFRYIDEDGFTVDPHKPRRAWLKGRKELGIVTNLYKTDSGQKRMTVSFPYSTVDAEVLNFELV